MASWLNRAMAWLGRALLDDTGRRGAGNRDDGKGDDGQGSDREPMPPPPGGDRPVATATVNGDAADASRVEALRWLERSLRVGRSRDPRSTDPAWSGSGEGPGVDEHLRQDIGLRDTRPGRRRLPWD